MQGHARIKGIRYAVYLLYLLSTEVQTLTQCVERHARSMKLLAYASKVALLGLLVMQVNLVTRFTCITSDARRDTHAA